MWSNTEIYLQWRNHLLSISFSFWFETLHLTYFSTITKNSRTSGETLQRPTLFLILIILSSFIEESEKSSPANRITVCLMFNSLFCSFHERQYMVFITYPLIYFMFLFLSVDSQVFENELSDVILLLKPRGQRFEKLSINSFW